jgi:hypothetical protein
MSCNVVEEVVVGLVDETVGAGLFSSLEQDNANNPIMLVISSSLFIMIDLS